MISIVMTYYNRKTQLIATLKSIRKSSFRDYEIIIVDDASSSNERLDDIKDIFNFRLIRIEKQDKWYCNCCIPFNIGISQAKGDIIVLQNPECLHVGDVLSFIQANLTVSTYLAISTYALDKDRSSYVRNRVDNIRLYINNLPQEEYRRKVGWYNHPTYNPTYYHFCSAISASNMRILGGFDERYAHGVAYDDNELVERITRLNLQKIIPTEVFVIHQWHPKVMAFSFENYRERHERNKTIFHILTKNEDTVYKKNSYV